MVSLVVDNIGISSNVIRSKSGGGNTIFIDPYPDGLDSDGMVIIKGSLQVDGTTTTVNSTNTSLNDPIMNIGDVTSKRTVTATVGSGTSAITLDSIVGINTGDQISGSNSLPGKELQQFIHMSHLELVLELYSLMDKQLVVFNNYTINNYSWV